MMDGRVSVIFIYPWTMLWKGIWICMMDGGGCACLALNRDMRYLGDLALRPSHIVVSCNHTVMTAAVSGARYRDRSADDYIFIVGFGSNDRGIHHSNKTH